MLELINETRLDPLGSAGRYISSYAPLASPDANISQALSYFGVNGAALLSAYQALVPVGALAWNEALGSAAQLHGAAMIAAQIQSHQVPGEVDLGTRFHNAGYFYNYAGENIYAYAKSIIYGHAGLMVDWGSGPDGMQNPAGHRANFMNATFTEVGIDITAENSNTNPLGTLVLTEDFGCRGRHFVLGVAYTDNDHNAFYSPGEGRADLVVQEGAHSANSTSSGGYGLEVATGARSILLSGGGLAGILTVQSTISTENLKLDVVDGHILLSSGSIAVSGTAVDTIRGLGVRGLTLTAGDGAQTITGTRGADTLDGGGGNDTLNGGLGDDSMLGGSGNDSYTVDSALDRVYETTTTGSTINAGGIDTVFSSVTINLNAYAGVRFVEQLTLTGSGNIAATGNALANTITGNGGNNILNGGGGNDTLTGGAGNDRLVGGAGNDTLQGNAGLDRFDFTAALGASNVDTIMNFVTADDTIRLDDAIFAGIGAVGTKLAAGAFALGTAATQADDRIIYDSGSGHLLFDADGSGPTAAIHFATVSGLTGTLSAADFLII